MYSYLDKVKMLKASDHFTDLDDFCCVCTSRNQTKYNKIAENFVKIETKFTTLRELILNQFKLIHYKVNFQLFK